MTAPTKALAAVLIGLAFQVVASAAPRARFRAETILNDPVVRIAAGPDYACQVNDDGTVQCWGNNYLGQLGDARTAFRSTPALVPGVTGAIAVTAGTGFACALIVDETVRCWGGGLRLGGPTKIPGLFSVVAISAGDAHVCAIISPGFVRCLGYNFEGELGDPSAPQFSSAPVSVLNLFPTFPAVAIRSGYRYSCILSDQGTVLCWGRSKEVFYGNAIDIAAGSRHMCALISDGTVTCWGDDSQGQLGGPPFSPVAGVTRAVAVGVGPNHSCAVLAAGNAVCWGDGRAGQLGDGSTVTRQPTPVPVAGSTRFAAIVGGGDAEGRSHTCALLGDGSVRCWGANAFGQLGDGTTIPKSTPIAVLNSGGTFSARDLAAGSQHTC
ncbi:MAG TPA: RCC1 repeat-containing protein, partial [Solibacterales bacterium]|nr:RCC1 repeat-containing protein [Bryobacterales bacterium]